VDQLAPANKELQTNNTALHSTGTENSQDVPNKFLLAALDKLKPPSDILTRQGNQHLRISLP